MMRDQASEPLMNFPPSRVTSSILLLLLQLQQQAIKLLTHVEKQLVQGYGQAYAGTQRVQIPNLACQK